MIVSIIFCKMSAARKVYYNYMLKIKAILSEADQKSFLESITCQDADCKVAVYFIDMEDGEHTGVYLTSYGTHALKFNYEFVNSNIGKVKCYTVPKGQKNHVGACCKILSSS